MTHEVQPIRLCNLATAFSSAHCYTLGLIACAEGLSGAPANDPRLRQLHQLARQSPIAYRDRINAYSEGFRAGHSAASQIVIYESDHRAYTDPSFNSFENEIKLSDPRKRKKNDN